MVSFRGCSPPILSTLPRPRKTQNPLPRIKHTSIAALEVAAFFVQQDNQMTD